MIIFERLRRQILEILDVTNDVSLLLVDTLFTIRKITSIES
jgi:hypothetical protein